MSASVWAESLEQQRQAIRAHYTPLLKSMSVTDPAYARLWDERAEKLRALAGEQAVS